MRHLALCISLAITCHYLFILPSKNIVNTFPVFFAELLSPPCSLGCRWEDSAWEWLRCTAQRRPAPESILRLAWNNGENHYFLIRSANNKHYHYLVNNNNNNNRYYWTREQDYCGEAEEHIEKALLLPEIEVMLKMVETMQAQEKKIGEGSYKAMWNEGPEHGNEVGGSIWAREKEDWGQFTTIVWNDMGITEAHFHCQRALMSVFRMPRLHEPHTSSAYRCSLITWP